MRIAAGILMILAGFTSVPLIQTLVEMFGETMNSIFVPLCLLLLGLTVGGGICAFGKKAYWWALAGAISSVLVALTFTITSLVTFPISFLRFAHPGAAALGAAIPGIIFSSMGMLAIIFLIMRRGEFQG